MRGLLWALLGLALVGCGSNEPTTVGGKTLDYWLESLHGTDPVSRKKAVAKIGNVGPTNEKVLPALQSALKDSDAGVRKEAVLALMKFGAEAKSALSSLQELAQNDKDDLVREAARKAVERFEKP